MNKVVKLVRGELVRLYKNKIIPVSAVVSLIWILLIVFSSTEEVAGLLPMILVLDAGMLGIIYLAASFYLEKQEGSLKSLFVSPLSAEEILVSKIIVSLITGLVSSALLVLTFRLVHKQDINFLWLFLSLLFITLSHSLLGFVIILNCRDFAQMLGIYAAYALLFFLPTVLFLLEIIPGNLEILLLVSPTHSAFVLAQKAFGEGNWGQAVGALAYLAVLGAGLYRYVIGKFKEHAVQG
ncbi:MAG TPA: ABC transporter permease [Acholeplasmataceae bacterium]|nr:ABC transporter permease [Acholeplasmataceae bacterium]